MNTATCEQCGLSGLDVECDLVCYACERDANERGYEDAIRDVRLVLAVIQAFEALRERETHPLPSSEERHACDGYACPDWA